jgi:hypothetical protein
MYTIQKFQIEFEYYKFDFSIMVFNVINNKI